MSIILTPFFKKKEAPLDIGRKIKKCTTPLSPSNPSPHTSTGEMYSFTLNMNMLALAIGNH